MPIGTEHLKKQYYAGKTVVMNTKGYMHLLIGKRGGEMAHKACRWTLFKESFFIWKETEAVTVASVSNDTDENTTIEDSTSIHSNIQYIQYPFGFKCFV